MTKTAQLFPGYAARTLSAHARESQCAYHPVAKRRISSPALRLDAGLEAYQNTNVVARRFMQSSRHKFERDVEHHADVVKVGGLQTRVATSQLTSFLREALTI